MRATYVRKVKANRSDAFTFYFLPEQRMRFTAGQYTELSLKEVGRHWFTVSSRPGLSEISITTRLTGSPFKTALNSLRPGSIVDLAEPMGDFVLPIDLSIPILMVAGGIGITPFLSILGDSLKAHTKRSLSLLYAASSSEDFVDLAKYQSLLSNSEHLVGRLEAMSILDMASGLNKPYIYISGPEPMVEKLVSDLKDRGVGSTSLVADYFPGYV